MEQEGQKKGGWEYCRFCPLLLLLLLMPLLVVVLLLLWMLLLLAVELLLSLFLLLVLSPRILSQFQAQCLLLICQKSICNVNSCRYNDN